MPGFLFDEAKPGYTMAVLDVMEISTGIRRAARRRRPAVQTREGTAPSEAPTQGSVAVRQTERARRAGGPQDRAVYSCGCGYLFSATVTASTPCPRCGEDQAW